MQTKSCNTRIILVVKEFKGIPFQSGYWYTGTFANSEDPNSGISSVSALLIKIFNNLQVKIYTILNKFACQNDLKYKMDYSIHTLYHCVKDNPE